MKILVTGGSGYLGSILTRKLLAKNHNVRILDNFLFGKESIKEIQNSKNLEIIDGDIRDLSIVSKAIKGVDAVIHLASIVGTQSAELDPKTSMEVNFMATRNIAELCKLYKIKQFIFASTCSVYGAQPDQLISENSEVDPNLFANGASLTNIVPFLFSKVSPGFPITLLTNLFPVESYGKGGSNITISPFVGFNLNLLIKLLLIWVS